MLTAQPQTGRALGDYSLHTHNIVIVNINNTISTKVSLTREQLDSTSTQHSIELKCDNKQSSRESREDEATKDGRGGESRKARTGT